MTWALVLSGGGPAALAWQTALLAGLRDGGADLTRPDLLVGTSAGALLGGQLLGGHDLGRLLDRQREVAPGACVVRSALSGDDAWPELPYHVTALDADSEALAVWSRAAGVSLADAVASS
jgi:hypothetical protein